MTKKSLTEKYGRGKDVNLRETRKEPSLLTRYRDSKKSTIRPPLDHEALAAEENTPEPDWDSLLNDVLSLPTGQANANHYERAIESLLSAIFYPSLSNPQPQRQIHDGRKRIDLTYTNVATRGFFHWLSQHYPAPHVFVECKNYVDDPANPELDQLSGRFSRLRGKFGLLVCRTIANKSLFAARCRDTAQDDRGFIVYLDDADLSELVELRKSAVPIQDQFALLKSRMDSLIM